uniref:Uncharacterized protein n=1 Tax=Cacopsylla melanoneura TaxID=428564 RepID=A0A8D9BAL6_9HEMI
MINKYILNSIFLTFICLTLFLLSSGYTLKEHTRPKFYHKLLRKANNEKEIIAGNGQTNGDCKDCLHRMRRDINVATATFKNKEEEAKFEQFKKNLGRYLVDLRVLGYTNRLDLLRSQIQGKMYLRRQEEFMRNILSAAQANPNKDMQVSSQMKYGNVTVFSNVVTLNKSSDIAKLLDPKQLIHTVFVNPGDVQMVSMDDFRNYIDFNGESEKNKNIHVNNQANQTRT